MPGGPILPPGSGSGSVGTSAIVQRSALDLILSALRLIGAIGSGDPISVSEQNDAQLILNDLLDSWNAQKVMIFQSPRTPNDQNGNPFTLVPGRQGYTLGNVSGAENLLLARPPRLERVSIMYSASQSTPVEIPLYMADEVEWQAIANKTTPSLLPQVCHDDLGFPDRTLFFWPIPTQANPIVLYPWAALQLFSDLTTKISFPPAYSRALRYNLAVDLAAEFPGDPNKLPLVIKIAAQSKDVITSFNAEIKVAWCDEALLGTRPRGNIFTGSPNRSHSF
jgi:hypothetical protein